MGLIRYIKSCFSRQPGVHTAASNCLKASEHGITLRQIDKQATKILSRLEEAGFGAYLVGGCVRDLLLGLQPKDFDIVTDAKPEEVQKLFRHCYLVGRRFRIAHVRYGRDVYEVSTFRAGQAGQQHSDQGLLMDDNQYGTLEDDVWRRDFTINALYYNLADQSVVDHALGMRDIRAKQIRIIGEPSQRFTEDPIRVLRAARFAAKLQFTIEEKTAAPMTQMCELLAFVAPARLFLECEKMFGYGYALAAYQALREYRLFGFLFSQTQVSLDSEYGQQVDAFLQATFANTDKRVLSGKAVTPAFFVAALLWYPFLHRVALLQETQQLTRINAEQVAASQICQKQLENLAIPKRYIVRVKEIWQLQVPLCQRRHYRVRQLLQHPRFRAA